MKRFFVFLLFISQTLLLGHGFAGNTPIKDTQGWQDIAQLCVRVTERDQLILSYDSANKQYLYKKISVGAHAHTPCYVRLSFDDAPSRDDILCTPTQAFYVTDGREWVPAFQLSVDDELLSEQHQTKRLKRVTLEEEPLQVYSIEVQDTHTFFVGGHAVLTHNMFMPTTSYALVPTIASLAWRALAAPIATLGPVPVFVVGGVASAAIIGFVVKQAMSHGMRKYQLSYNTRSIAQSIHATAMQCGARFERERKDQIPVCGTTKQFPSTPIPGPCMNDTWPQEPKSIWGEQKMPEAPMPICIQQVPASPQGTCGMSTSTINSHAREDKLLDHEVMQAKSDRPLQNSEPETQSTNPYGKNYKPAGPNGTYQDAGYHTQHGNSRKSPCPKNGQAALDNSVPYGTQGHRIGISEGQIVVLRVTDAHVKLFHGYVILSEELLKKSENIDMKKALSAAGLIGKNGTIKKA